MSIDSETVADAAGVADDDATESEIITPVVVDLGKVKRKHVKRLKRGTGRLADEVLDVMDEVVDLLGEELEGATLVPIVMIYEKKPKKRRRTIELPF